MYNLEMKNLVEIKNLEKKYAVKSDFYEKKDEFIYAVNKVNLNIREGEILGIVGESGCGKSTLGKCVLRLEDGYSGQIIFDGKDISQERNLKIFRKSAQMIFQNPYASLNPRMKIYDILKEPLIIHGEKDEKTIKEKINEVCELTGIDKTALNYYPHEFSGGQRQRISIASAIILKPKFIVADEPVSALDVSIRAQIINLLKELKEKLKLTILFISHDLSVVRHICDRTAVMYLGEIVELVNNEDLFNEPKHPYTKALLSSVPIISREKRQDRIILSGDVPSPKNLPTGCKFHTRCPEVMQICAESIPDIRCIDKGHKVKCHLYIGCENL